MADSVATIVSEAATELGLGAVSDVYGSTDAAVIQLRTLLKGLGQDLVDEFDWQILVKETTFATVASTTNYALPTDFAREVPETRWNRTTSWQAGVISPQLHQEQQAISSVSLINKYARIRGGRLYIVPTPTAAETVAYEYVSTWWVSAAGGTAPTTDAPSANTDLVWFDRRLTILGLKLRFLESKGFAVDAAQAAYERRLESQKAGDGLYATVYLGARRTGPKWATVPDTGVGG